MLVFLLSVYYMFTYQFMACSRRTIADTSVGLARSLAHGACLARRGHVVREKTDQTQISPPAYDGPFVLVVESTSLTSAGRDYVCALHIYHVHPWSTSPLFFHPLISSTVYS